MSLSMTPSEFTLITHFLPQLVPKVWS